MIYWFTGASTQAVTTGAYRAVEFIKANIKLEGVEKASVADSKKVVAICTKYAQKGMLNIFIAVFFGTLAFAFVDPFYFVGYLISIAIFGLYQAIFMANAGAAWDNAKKIVEVEMKQKGTPLHDATVIGDTVGDPFKDTSSVALNPVIKFTTLFGLLAVELAVKLASEQGTTLTRVLARRSSWCRLRSCTGRSTGCGSSRARSRQLAGNMNAISEASGWRFLVELRSTDRRQDAARYKKASASSARGDRDSRRGTRVAVRGARGARRHSSRGKGRGATRSDRARFWPRRAGYRGADHGHRLRPAPAPHSFPPTGVSQLLRVS